MWPEEFTVKVLKIDEDLSGLCDQNVVYIGSNDRKLMNLSLSLKCKYLYEKNKLLYANFIITSKLSR